MRRNPTFLRGLIASLFALTLVSFGNQTQASEIRCGWIANPTPGNWWLTDRDGDWTIATQGSESDPGLDVLGDISAGDYVATNGPYGYACGCMRVTVDGNSRTILQIHSFRQKRISDCKRDPELAAPQ